MLSLATLRVISLAALSGALALACGASEGESSSSSSPAPSDSPATPKGPADDAAVPTTPQDPLTTPPSPSIDLGPAGDFGADATKVAAALDAFYDGGTGLFSTTGWWNSANGVTALVDFMAVTKTAAYTPRLATTFAKNKSASFLNNFYDDEGWWALAWIRAYDLTHDADYLTTAKTIFADMAGGWDATCGGGIWWSKDRTYKNAIANELFLKVAASLHNRTPGDAGPASFVDWASREWAWFAGSGMINGKSLVNDGLSSCKNNGQPAYTYNQGVVLGGLAELAKATGDKTVLTQARAIADATMATLVDDNGVLREPCEPTCGGDGTQFKGIFMRNLSELTAAAPAPEDRPFLAKNADYVWNAARNGSDQIGLVWSGPFDTADAARQSSALDALVAAIPYSEPVTNVALGKPATGNGTCGATEGPDKAVDGLTTTKWCAGTTSGAYWLEIDLRASGAAALIGRVVLRHAGAGGEKEGFDTKDFTLSTSIDGTTWTQVAQRKNNMRSVTIHSFAPVQAARLRLDIQAPQTDPATVAARIDELEAYAR
jgi:predicted alpha-1,6-mannanase (GH76 family)